MNGLTTELAKALNLISFASTDRGARDTAKEALRLYDAAKAEPVQDLPPLPHAVAHILLGDDSENVFTTEQMHAYARAALEQLRCDSATPAPEPQWQPIETAPKDGDFLLGVWEGSWHNPRKRFQVYQARHGFVGKPSWAGNYRTEEGEAYEIAGWMPLPAAPEAGQGKEANHG